MFRTRNGDIRLSYVFCLFFVNIIFLFTFLEDLVICHVNWILSLQKTDFN